MGLVVNPILCDEIFGVILHSTSSPGSSLFAIRKPQFWKPGNEVDLDFEVFAAMHKLNGHQDAWLLRVLLLKMSNTRSPITLERNALVALNLALMCSFILSTILFKGDRLQIIVRYVQKCRHRAATLLHYWHHKVSSPIKVHQNTRNFVTYEIMWKRQTTLSNMKYSLNNTCLHFWT